MNISLPNKKQYLVVFSLNTLLSWVMKLFLFSLIWYEFFLRNYLFVFGAIVALVLSLLPAIIAHSYNTNLPWIIDFAVTLSLTLNAIGTSLGFYGGNSLVPIILIDWWDRIAHVVGTATIGLLAFMVVYTLHFVGKIKMSIPLIGFFTFVTAVAIGAIWEMGEYSFDLLFHTQSYGNGDGILNYADAVDTAEDLIADGIGGAVVALWGMFYVGREKHKKLSRVFEPLGKIFAPQVMKVSELKARLKERRIRRRMIK